MSGPAQKTNVNSFGSFLKTVETDDPTQRASTINRRESPSDRAPVVAGTSTDPQLMILQVLADRGGLLSTLDLMKSTKLAPTLLSDTVRTMQAFGLVTIDDAAGGTPNERLPHVQLTPSGRETLELYK